MTAAASKVNKDRDDKMGEYDHNYIE